ncbi:hypothetical protein P4644_23830 [Priestia aryabhattai]|uniref:hypothetical protein n=1 Tax=Priestia aryabhattai TaxID=412384 RepID=UPI002E1B54B0|nr:hypothetical protein [Priestia aryabhattai]
MSTFTDIAFQNVQYDDTIHQVTIIEKDSQVVKKILEVKEVENFILNLEDIERHDYKGQSRYVVTIPVQQTDNKQEYLFVVLDSETNNIEKVRLMFIAQDNENTEIGFTHIDGSSKVSGTYSPDLELVKVEQGEDVIQTLSASSCLKKVFDSLPWWLRAACSGACAACFGLNPVGCAACAGCIGGVGLECI